MSTDQDNPSSLVVRVLDADDEITAAFPVMQTLRPHLQPDAFLATIRQQQSGGYVLAGGFHAGRLIALAGFRVSHTLYRGPHLFVDDLVTAPDAQRNGHGAAMIAWLRRHAASLGLERVWLDSRLAAKGFYERQGFTLTTSVPCWIAAVDS